MARKRERGEQSGGDKQRECATVRMKIYKYVRLGDDWVTEKLRKGESRKRRKKEEGVGERREEEEEEKV